MSFWSPAPRTGVSPAGTFPLSSLSGSRRSWWPRSSGRSSVQVGRAAGPCHSEPRFRCCVPVSIPRGQDCPPASEAQPSRLGPSCAGGVRLSGWLPSSAGLGGGVASAVSGCDQSSEVGDRGLGRAPSGPQFRRQETYPPPAFPFPGKEQERRGGGGRERAEVHALVCRHGGLGGNAHV